jgi:hypothetical protein
VKKTAAVLSLVLVLAFAGSACAYTSGVPVGLTGAPGEGTCANCHDNLNNGPGSVMISAPGNYSAGETIDVSVQVEHAGQVKWGFELTALNSSNEVIGQLVISDGVNTQLDVDGGNGRQYVMHTEDGTYTGSPDAPPAWDFQWTAPATREPVTFYACAVAANDGSGTNGDFCYTDVLSLQQTGIEDETTWGRIKGLYR